MALYSSRNTEATPRKSETEEQRLRAARAGPAGEPGPAARRDSRAECMQGACGRCLRCVVIDEFCCGCSLALGMTVVAYFAISVGVILLVMYVYTFSVYGYFISHDDTNTTSDTSHVTGGYTFAVLIITLLVIGIVADSVLLYAVYQRHEGLLCAWVALAAARAVALLAMVLPLWNACNRGGILCQLLRPTAMFLLSGIGLYGYAMVAAYSFALQIRILKLQYIRRVQLPA